MKSKKFLSFLKGSGLLFLGIVLLGACIFIIIKCIKYDNETEDKEITEPLMLRISQYEPADEEIAISEFTRVMKSKKIVFEDTEEDKFYIWLYEYDSDKACIQPMVITAGKQLRAGKR